MSKMKILFVCKHNVFRSRIAEEYAKKRGINANSAGLIKTKLPPAKIQLNVAKEFGLNIKQNSKPISIELLREQDKVIVVANDIPMSIFKRPIYGLKGKTSVWKIKDVKPETMEKDSKEIIQQIISKIDKFISKNN